MSTFGERYCKIGKESVFGEQASIYETINLVLSADMGSRVTIAEDEVLGPSRDTISRTPQGREGAGTLDVQLVSARLFEAILGSHTTSGTYVHTFTPTKELPSYTIERGIGDEAIR